MARVCRLKVPLGRQSSLALSIGHTQRWRCSNKRLVACNPSRPQASLAGFRLKVVRAVRLSQLLKLWALPAGTLPPTRWHPIYQILPAKDIVWPSLCVSRSAESWSLSHAAGLACTDYNLLGKRRGLAGSGLTEPAHAIWAAERRWLAERELEDWFFTETSSQCPVGFPV